MNAAQIAQRLFNTVRSTVARSGDITTQLEIYQLVVDELEREMGNLEDEGSADDEKFSQDDDDDGDEGV